MCFLFTISGLPMVTNLFSAWAPQAVIETVSSLSFVTNFQNISRGVLDARNLVYFASLIVFWLFLNTLVVGNRDGA